MSTEPITYEFKVKHVNLPWEKLPLWDAANFPPDDPTGPSAMAQRIANEEGREVRWNSQGSQQGHYVHPTTE